MAVANLLVLLLADGSERRLRQALAEREDQPHLHVVAPARMGALDWLATDEDDARTEAEVRALGAEWVLADRGDVEAEAGDVDPVQAVEDALRAFPADEILIVGGAHENGALEASLRQFGLPVTRLGEAASPPPSQLRMQTRAIVAGRSKATPFVFFAGVNLALLALAILISAVVLLVVWLL
jgi:hypothetical protein